jgi:hypothetical protein
MGLCFDESYITVRLFFWWEADFLTSIYCCTTNDFLLLTNTRENDYFTSTRTNSLVGSLQVLVHTRLIETTEAWSKQNSHQQQLRPKTTVHLQVPPQNPNNTPHTIFMTTTSCSTPLCYHWAQRPATQVAAAARTLWRMRSSDHFWTRRIIILVRKLPTIQSWPSLEALPSPLARKLGFSFK